MSSSCTVTETNEKAQFTVRSVKGGGHFDDKFSYLHTLQKWPSIDSRLYDDTSVIQLGVYVN